MLFNLIAPFYDHFMKFVGMDYSSRMVVEKLLGEPSTFWTPEESEAAFGEKGIRGDYEYLTSNQFIFRGVKANPD